MSCVDLGVGRVVDDRDEVADAEGVDAEPEPPLGLDLVALGDRDVAHVVAEAGDPARLPVALRARGPRPGADALLDLGVGPVADHDLALEAHPGRHEPELPVAVGGLVEVHEVHVDRVPGDLAVVLGVEVEERPLQGLEARRSTSWPARTCASRR